MESEVIQQSTEAGPPDGAAAAAGGESPAALPDDGWDWAVVEIMGHRKHAGRIREEERFGAKMLRVDIPIKGDPVKNGWETRYYGGPSIFSMSPCTEAVVMKLNVPYDAPSRYALPAPAQEGDDGDPGDDVGF
jgi:hypothetical protein